MKFLKNLFSKKDKDNNTPKPILLKTAENEYILLMIKGILDDNKIPYLTKDIMSGIVRVKTGSSMCGADIYVSEHDYKRAIELIEPLFSEESE